MIQIQIATSLHEEGVGGIRWVLLDPSEATVTAAALQAPVAGDEGVPTVPASVDLGPERSRAFGRQADRTYQVARAVVLAVALAGAWWMASNALDGGGTPPTTVTKAQR